MFSVPSPIRVVSRKSNLALKQVEEVFSHLTDVPYEVFAIDSYGDQHKEICLFDHNAPDFFTRELDQALLNDQADLAIHSAKDLPFPLPPGLELIALTEGKDKTDGLVSRDNIKLKDMQYGATIGTSSNSRKEGLLQIRKDLQIISIRGTIEERIKLIDDGKSDGIIVAICALQRLNLDHRIAEILPFKTHPLQGNLAVVAKAGNNEIFQLFSKIDVRKKYGKVFLTGFGPGDPDLLTIKGLKTLKNADIIYFDDLIAGHYLDRFCAEKVYVGKRKGKHSKEQDEINELLYQSALKGKTVVRLKGGDPMIFGRAGEEIEYLARNYIESEIIPGISSGFAAAALTKIPVTYRNISSSVTLCSGFSGTVPEINQKGTLIIYMAASTLWQTANDLLNKGWNKSTPVALIHNVSLPDQNEVFTTLGDIIRCEFRYQSPLIVIAGEAVKFKPNAKKEENKPVLLVTGTDPSVFEKYGTVIHQPVIKINPCATHSNFINQVSKIPFQYEWIIFTSKYAVRYFFELTGKAGKDSRFLSTIKVASIGATTTGELRKYGICPDIQPDDETSEGLVQEFIKRNDIPVSILIPRSDKALDILPDGLRKAGHRVDTWILYINEQNEVNTLIDLNDVHYVTLTSPSGVDGFLNYYKNIPSSLKFLVKGMTTYNKLLNRNFGMDRIVLFDDFTKKIAG